MLVDSQQNNTYFVILSDFTFVRTMSITSDFGPWILFLGPFYVP